MYVKQQSLITTCDEQTESFYSRSTKKVRLETDSLVSSQKEDEYKGSFLFFEQKESHSSHSFSRQSDVHNDTISTSQTKDGKVFIL